VPDKVHVWRKVSCLSVLQDGHGGQVTVRDCEQPDRLDTLPLPSLLPPSPANDKVLSCFTCSCCHVVYFYTLNSHLASTLS